MEFKRRAPKAFLTVLLSVVLAFSMLVTPVSAAPATGYFYGLLSSTEQGYYNTLYNGMKDQQEGDIVFAHGISWDNAKKIYDACRLDHVDLFWQANMYGTATYGPDCIGLIEHHIDWKTGSRAGKLAADAAAVTAKVTEIANGAKGQGSVVDQLKFVHDWLLEHNEYNWTAADGGENYMTNTTGLPWSAFSGLMDDFSPVCEGYARAFKMVCDELGIPCVITFNKEHMWNEVQVSGRWYAVDCTYDDPTGSRNPDGKGNSNHFLVGSNTIIEGQAFAATHPLGKASYTANAFSFPTISKGAYGTNTADAYETTVGSIKLSTVPKNKKIGKNETATITPKVNPKKKGKTCNEELKWTITGNAIFTETGSKEYTGEGAVHVLCQDGGNITVKAEATDGSKKKATVKLKGPKVATGVKLKPTAKKIDWKSTVQITPTLKPEKTVTENVTLTIKKGRAHFELNGENKGQEITVANNTPVSVYCEDAGDITVEAKPVGGKGKGTVKIKGPVEPKSVTVKPQAKTSFSKLAPGQTYRLTGIANPKGKVLDPTITWSVTTGEGTVATIDPATGALTTINPGQATVVATAKNGKSKSVKIKVVAPK